MVYMEIPVNHKKQISILNKQLSNKNGLVFILFYMEGCGPCNATRPEWAKLKNVLPKHILHNKNITIVSINHTLFGNLTHVKNEPTAFPTIRFIHRSIEENYEDAKFPVVKERTIDSFVEWITHKVNQYSRNQYSRNQHPHSRRQTKKHTYKKPIFRKKTMKK
jgi:thiol-disulfide isomerase/thioredoxin